MASLTPTVCRHLRSIAASRSSVCAGATAALQQQCGASAAAAAVRSDGKRRLHGSTVLGKEAGPIEKQLGKEQLDLAAQAARTTDPANMKGAPSAKVEQIAELVCQLNLVEAMQLAEVLKKKLGLPDNYNLVRGGGYAPPGGGAPAAAAPAAAPAAAAAPAPAAAPPKEEKATVDIKLKAFKPDAKIKVIKEVRAVTNLGLKEAKELVEGAPCTILTKVKKEEAAKIVEKLKAETGAELEMV